MVRLSSVLLSKHRSLFPHHHHHHHRSTPESTLDPLKMHLLRFDGGCRGNGIPPTRFISNNTNVLLPQTACGSIITSLEDEKDVLWQQAAWLWPGPSSSTSSSITPSSSFLSPHSSSSSSSSLMIYSVPGEVAATNNTAEFIALLEGLRAANSLGLKRLVIQGDSQLVMKLTTGEFTAHKLHLQLLVQAALALLSPLAEWSVRHVPRSLNSEADALCARGFELGESVDASVLIERYAHKCELSGATAGASFARDKTGASGASVDNCHGKSGTVITKEIPLPLSDVEVVIAPAWFHVASFLNKGTLGKSVYPNDSNSTSTSTIFSPQDGITRKTRNNIDEEVEGGGSERKRRRKERDDHNDNEGFFHMIGL